MMKRRVSDLSRDDVLTAIQPGTAPHAAQRHPGRLPCRCQLQRPARRARDRPVRFAHKTFQEYLAAAHIRDNGLVGVLADTVGDDWWAETTLLYAANVRRRPHHSACLNAGTRLRPSPSPSTATEQDSDVDPDLRRHVNDLVISAAKPDADQQRRRLFAAILLTRHMRQRERTTGGVQVCARPIPAEIYRLFLADTQTPEPDAPLAEPGIAVGMRSSDAAAFALWAIALAGGQQSYRLPLAAELSELAARHRIPALPGGRFPCPWAQADKASPESLPVLWLPPGAYDPYEINGAVLADACKLDAARSVFMLSGLLLRSRLQIRARGLARNLIRDRDRARDLALHLVSDLDLDRDLDLVRNLDLVRDRDRVRDLDYVRARDLALALDIDLVSALDLVSARDLGRALAHDLALDRDLAHVRDLALDLVSDLDRVRGLDRARDLDLVLDRARDLAVAIDETVNRYLASGPIHGLDQPILDTTCRFLLGRAFSDAITEILLRSNQPDRWTARFAAAFTDATGAGRAEHLTADPATMEATLLDAVTKLADALNEELADLPDAASWRSAMAERLRRNAGPVFARAERPTPEKTATIRMAALCLAAEADGMERKDIGDQFRQLAAGITLLHRRGAVERQAIEVIMLAVG